jgi:hypothetical protein
MNKLIVACGVLIIGCFCDASAQTQKIDNRDKSFTLIKNDTINSSGLPLLKYKVIRNADNKTVLEGSVTMGVIEWSADYELEETRSLGSGHAQQNKRKIDLRSFR